MNKKIIISIISVAIGIVFVQFIMNYDFLKFQFKETKINNQISISVPGELELETTILNTAVGEIKLSIYTLEKNKIVYMILHSDYPKDYISNSDKKVILDNARDGGVRNSHGTLLTEEIFNISSFPGRDIKVEGPNGEILRFKILLVNNTLYQWGVGATKQTIYSKSVLKFFDSFKLLNE